MFVGGFNARIVEMACWEKAEMTFGTITIARRRANFTPG